MHKHYVCDCNCTIDDIEVVANNPEEAEEEAFNEMVNILINSGPANDCYCECEEVEE